MNKITMELQADHLIREALKEDISSEDVSTNAVMKEYVKGQVDLICKQDGIIAGLDVFRGCLNCWMIRQRQSFSVKTATRWNRDSLWEELQEISACFYQGRELP